MSTKGKFESSLNWQTLNVVSQILLQLGFIAIMSRLLSREDFGYLTIALVVVGFIEIFSQIGIGPALIQRKDLKHEQINGAFHISIILGVFFFIFLLVIAPSVATYYEHEPLTAILRVIGFSFIISAISIVPKSLIIKKMQFKKLFVASMFAMIIGNYLVGVTLAYQGYNIWAYVFALLAQNLVMSVFYWIQNPIKITRNWSFSETRSMLRYGAGSTLFNLFNYAASKIDVVIIGKYGGDINQTITSENRWANTGVYDRSVYLNSLPITVLGKLSDSVMFSGLSMIQDQQERLQKTFLTGTYLVSMLIIPATAFLIFFAPEIVISFYSDKFADVIPIVRVLFISVALRSLIKLCDAVVRALDAVYVASAIKFLFFLMIGAGTYIGLSYGLTGVAYGVVISVFIQFILMQGLTCKLLGLKFSRVLKKMIPGLALSIAVAIASIPIFFLIHYLELGPLLGLIFAMIGNLLALIALAWKMPWLYGKGKDNILIFILNKMPNFSFLRSLKNKLNMD